MESSLWRVAEKNSAPLSNLISYDPGTRLDALRIKLGVRRKFDLSCQASPSDFALGVAQKFLDQTA